MTVLNAALPEFLGSLAASILLSAGAHLLRRLRARCEENKRLRKRADKMALH
ncbi:hypothetical protein [Streptomyces sp. HUAS TT7]|uniref:hypothetical protein n=1 Tax=Streptomyces sp. HUAS TT7 TaxID=3447507 RepID=UPI003F65DA34